MDGKWVKLWKQCQRFQTPNVKRWELVCVEQFGWWWCFVFVSKGVIWTLAILLKLIPCISRVYQQPRFKNSNQKMAASGGGGKEQWQGVNKAEALGWQEAVARLQSSRQDWQHWGSAQGLGCRPFWWSQIGRLSCRVLHTSWAAFVGTWMLTLQVDSSPQQPQAPPAVPTSSFSNCFSSERGEGGGMENGGPIPVALGMVHCEWIFAKCSFYAFKLISREIKNRDLV